MSPTPQQRVHDATRRLLDLLEAGDSSSPEAIGLRAELAEATAASGHLEDALYQADELLKDARREHGEGHETVAAARRTVAGIEQLARESLTGGEAAGARDGGPAGNAEATGAGHARAHQGKPDSSS